MKKLFFTASIFILAIMLTHNLYAKEIKMIFWYPGEAGTTAEAAPILDELFKYLNPKIYPDKISGKYFNNVPNGLKYISSDKPTIGIISYLTMTEQGDKIGNPKVIMSTIPSVHGKTTEVYSLVGKVTAIPANPTIFMSEPIPLKFALSQLFPSLKSDTRLSQTSQIVAKLKDISEDKLQAFAILTPTEAYTLQSISASWAKGLKTIMKSNSVPTAMVVLFDPEWKGIKKLKPALMQMASDPAAKDILNELRLTGFVEK